MRLHDVRIRNFRSVKKADIDFRHRCRVLVGINETGKSNILRALALLDPTTTPAPEDIRTALPTESPITEASVEFQLLLDQAEIALAFQSARNRILAREADPSLILVAGQPTKLRAFLATRTVSYDVDLKPSVLRSYRYFTLTTKYTLAKGWMAVDPDAAQDVQVTVKETARPLTDFVLVKAADFPQLAKYLRAPTLDTVSTLVGQAVVNGAKASKLPAVVSWRYADSHLLPASITSAEFVANPSMCLPLKQMFLLSGYSDIQAAFADAAVIPNGMKNLLKRVARLATDHLHRIWPDAEKLKIELEQDGSVIRATVLDAFNSYDFARRSDGFKRFASYLLVVSASVTTGEFTNTLLLVDEPEGGLHPSGARFLRDELLRAANTNYVVYSTHSTHMIDREKVDRHLIITKSREQTHIESAGVSNFLEEEVLFNALGASIFEHLKAKNILFEGWRDKKLFDVALKAASEATRHRFKHIGLAHLKGVRTVKHVVPILQLSRRGCLIVTDDDPPAISEQKEHSKERMYGVWVRYSHLCGDESIATGEDFVAAGAFTRALKSLRTTDPTLPPDEPDWEHPKGRLAGAKAWLAKAGIEPRRIAEAIEAIKDLVFERLTADDIEDSYAAVVRGLARETAKLRT